MNAGTYSRGKILARGELGGWVQCSWDETQWDRFLCSPGDDSGSSWHGTSAGAVRRLATIEAVTLCNEPVFDNARKGGAR